jgi:hypothetical protein
LTVLARPEGFFRIVDAAFGAEVEIAKLRLDEVTVRDEIRDSFGQESQAGDDIGRGKCRARPHDQWHGIFLAWSIDAKSPFGSVYPAEYQ